MKMRIILFLLICVNLLHSMELAPLVPSNGQITAQDISILSRSFKERRISLILMQCSTAALAVLWATWAFVRGDDLKPWEAITMLASTGGPAAIMWFVDTWRKPWSVAQTQQILDLLHERYAPVQDV